MKPPLQFKTRNRIPQRPGRSAVRQAGAESDLSPRLPLLERLEARLGRIDGSVQWLFGLQHLFGSTATLVRRVTQGIPARRVFLLGKPYSANPEVIRYLHGRLGFWVHPDTCRQSVEGESDAELDQRVASTLDLLRDRLAARKERQSRVLLIDDGGRAIRMLHSPRFADIRRRFTCVEQTRAGVRAIQPLELDVPVINVAESGTKLEVESPMIASSVNRELTKILKAMETAGIPTGNRALVVGFGAIGRAVSAELRRRGRHVAVFDSLPERCAHARHEDYLVYTHLDRALRRGGVVIGCTGKPVLDRDDYARIPEGTILVSASSADVEFRAWQLRPGAECLGRPEAWADGDAGGTGRDHHPCFSLYRVRGAQGRFYLVNGGFPVNFTGGVDPIRPERIQLTRGLLYLGALQASQATEPGLHALFESWQQLLLNAFDPVSDQSIA